MGIDHGPEPGETIVSSKLQRLGLGLFGGMAILSLVVAVATMWLVLANPVLLANAVSQGDLSPFLRGLERMLRTAAVALLGLSSDATAAGPEGVRIIGELTGGSLGVPGFGPLVLLALGIRLIASRAIGRALPGDAGRVRRDHHDE